MMKVIRTILFLSLATVFLFSLTGAASADTLAEIIKRGELRVACQSQGPPFSFVDKNGNRTGSSVELCRLMAKEMGVKVKFLDFDWDGLIPALLTKKADILAADMTTKLKRALKVSFTKPFYVTGQIAYVRADSPFKTIGELNSPDVTIAGLLGSTYTDTAKRVFPKAKIKLYKGGSNISMNAVVAKHAHASVIDDSNFRSLASAYPKGTLKAFEKKLSFEPLAFAVRPDDRHLLEWVNLFFDWIKGDGRYEENMQYWIKTLDWKKDH